MSKAAIIVLGIVILVLGGIYVSRRSVSPPGPSVTDSSGSTPTPTPDKNITVSQPLLNEDIDYILTIRGTARVFENAFSYRLKDIRGNVLASGHSMADSPDIGLFGPFLITTAYKAPSSDSGVLEVFANSAKDGTEIDKVTTVIRFPAGPASSFNVFFLNSEKNPGTDCQTVFPVPRRVAKTPAIARAAVASLLSGPTTEELEDKYSTSINSGVNLNSLVISNGVARIDFDNRMEEGVAGSCRVIAIRSQIEATLKQFPAVREVVISVNGRTDDILQP